MRAGSWAVAIIGYAFYLCFIDTVHERLPADRSGTIMIGGPMLLNYVTPSEEELRKVRLGGSSEFETGAETIA